ncbi:MAG: D-glycero-beta-D-manno-heptose-7-phosphate kinase [Proteobacteria bacterium]|nr:D-glycero-beta-D-manno-heptose-7-phosphate kinase [Pseudomonadota bacterium]
MSKVLVVGDLMVDQFIWGKVSRISPEAPVPVVEVTSENFLLGGSANVLNNISSMGGNVHVTGIIGSDDMGRLLTDKLRKMNVDTGGVIVEHDRPTTVKTRIIAHHQQVVRFDRENKQSVSLDSVEKMVEYVETIGDLGAIVISDYSKGIVSKRLLKGVSEVISGRDIVVCIDPKQNDFSLYQGFDVITPNHHEAGRALGMEIVSEDDLINGGETLLERFGFKAVLITRGEDGMSLFENGAKNTHIPTVAREVFDVTGAGDTVVGVFALCMAAGATFKEAAVLANHAAGIVVGKVGTATVSQEELRKML